MNKNIFIFAVASDVFTTGKNVNKLEEVSENCYGWVKFIIAEADF